MNTRKLRKMILTLCSALLLVSMSVGLTVAYLTDTEAVTNTFTVGQVGICLDETDCDNSNTNPITEETCDNENHSHGGRDRGNAYKLYPNGTYVKDPKIQIHDDCDMGYLRVVVTFENATAAVQALNMPMEEIFVVNENSDAWGSWNSNDLDGQPTWTRTTATTDNNVVYTLTFNDYIDKETPDITLFESIVIPETMTNEQIALLSGVNMKIQAYAVQADGFDAGNDGFTLTDAATAFATAFEGTF